MKYQIDPLHAPSWTAQNFLLVVTTFVVALYSFGQTFIESPVAKGDPQYFDIMLDRVIIVLCGSFLGAVFLFIAFPVFVRRSFGGALDASSHREMFAHIVHLSCKAEIRNPKILIDSDIRNVDAIAFGAFGKSTILLGRGFLRLFKVKRQLFDVRLLHEMGHIYNKDVFRAYFSISMIIMLAFVWIAGTLPYVMTIFNNIISGYNDWVIKQDISIYTFIKEWIPWLFTSIFSLKYILLKTMSLLIILVLVQRLYLRSREYYADCFASSIIGAPSAVSAFGRQNKITFLDRIKLPFSAHPTISNRVRLVNNPNLLNAVNWPAIFFTGYVCGLTYYLLETSPHRDFMDSFSIEDIFGPKQKDISFLKNIAFIGIIFTLCYSSILFVMVNLCSRVYFSDTRLRELFISAIAVAFLTYSFVLALFINPFTILNSLEFQLPWNHMSSKFDFSNSYMWLLNNVAIFLLLYPLLRRLYTSKKAKRPSSTLWIILLVFVALTLNWLLSLLVIAISDGFDNERQKAMAAVVSCYAAVAYSIAYLIARRSLRIGVISSASIAPWLQRRPTNIECR